MSQAVLAVMTRPVSSQPPMWNTDRYTTTTDLLNGELCVKRALHGTISLHHSTGCVSGPVENVTYSACSAVEDRVAYIVSHSSDAHQWLYLEWTVYHTAALAIFFLLLLILLSLLLRPLNSDLLAATDDLCSPPSNDVVGLAARLEGLTLATSLHTTGRRLSWLRRAEQLKLLSSTPHTAPPPVGTPASLHAQQPLLKPARFSQPRACLMSATASLSLTDQSPWPLLYQQLDN